MVKLASRSLCNGCQACACICPVKCIDFIVDDLGFSYPKIREAECLHCHACEKICPVLNRSGSAEMPLAVYAVKNRNEKERLNSSSGGFFPALARAFVEQGGVVFGAAWTLEWNVHHQPAVTSEQICPLMGSKYLPSDTGDSFLQCQELLDSKRLVLFTGTPCQIAGLSRFLKHPYPNLLLMEVICRGVSSPVLFQRYLQELKQTQGNYGDIDISQINFRDKQGEHGWRNYHVTIAGDGKASLQKITLYNNSHHKNPFFRLFLNGLILRNSCHDCRIKNQASVADFTVGDAWRVHEIFPDFDDNKGASWVCVRSEHGRKWLMNLKDVFDIRQTDFKVVLERNPSVSASTKRPARQKKFRRVATHFAIDELAEKFTYSTMAEKVKDKFVSLVKRTFPFLKRTTL